MKNDGLVDEKALEKMHRTNIMTAYSGGMSVVEITDALQAIKCQFVHDVLRRVNLIPHVEKRDSKSAQELDPRLQSALKHRNYSFLLWCLGCGLSPAETASKLKEQPGECLSSAHEAVKRDFPTAYAEIFDEIPTAKESWRVRTRAPRFSLHVVWDEERAGYVASVPEIPGVMVMGKNWTEALENMLVVLRLQRYIALLDNVLEIRGIPDKEEDV